jgi:hypothetical protein
MAAAQQQGPSPVQGITAVASKVNPDYVRVRLADGSFEPEPYAFWEGGRLDGTVRDPSMDGLKFTDIARIIAGPLAAQKYLPTRDQSKQKLLIVVFWGTTVVPTQLNFSTGVMTGNGAFNYMDNMQRDLTDYRNAKILGYSSEPLVESDFGNFMTVSGVTGLFASELMSEIEDSRYFVVLMAYDFQLLRAKNVHKKLWETRFSINEQKNHFDRALPAMVRYASNYFGQETKGLVRTKIPEGEVSIGEVRSLGQTEAPGK